MIAKTPKGWQRVKLGDVAEINNGKSNSEDSNPTGIYPLFDRSMLTKKSDRYLFDKEAVIIPGEGKEFAAKYYYGKFDLHQRCYAIHSFNKNIFPKFCYYYLMNSSNYFRSVAVGSTVPSLRLGHFQRLPIIFPPFSEQKSILTLLEKWDIAIEKTEALIAAKQRQFKWLVKMLIEQKQYINGWQEVKLGEVGNFSKGNGITKSELVKNGVPCIRYGELYTKHDIKVKKFYSFIENKNLDKYTRIKNNSLLFAGTGETREEIGKCASFNHSIEVYAGGDVIILSIDPANLNAEFASFYLNTKGRKQINRLGQGNSIVHIYSRFLQNIKIPCPPISEQNAIVKILNTAEREIILLEQLAGRYQVQKRGLMNKLLTGEWRISA